MIILNRIEVVYTPNLPETYCISIEIQNKNNLTTAIINKGTIEISKVINQTLENYYKNSLKIKFK